MMSTHTIELLGTEGCHLCEEAQLILHDVVRQTGVAVQLVDIAEQSNSEVLIERYGLRIPVLRSQQRELDWPFGVEQVLQWVQRRAIGEG